MKTLYNFVGEGQTGSAGRCLVGRPILAPGPFL